MKIIVAAMAVAAGVVLTMGPQTASNNDSHGAPTAAASQSAPVNGTNAQLNTVSSPRPAISAHEARDAEPGALGNKNASPTYETSTDKWSGCSAIAVQANLAGAPRGAELDIQTAVQKIATASGLPLQYTGTTSQRPSRDWVHSASREILIAWDTPSSGIVTDGAGATTTRSAVHGQAGSLDTMAAMVVANSDLKHLYRPGFGKKGSLTAMLMHELGHAVGLSHVDDAHQLMHSDALLNRDFGAGDLEGLKAVGQSCN